jgi:hypothetical protein
VVVIEQYQTVVTTIVTGVLTSPTQIVKANPRRVWINFLQSGAGGNTFLTTMADGLLTSALFGISQNVNELLLRKDLGPIVEGELWFSDGAGNTPACTMTITEGILL